MPWEKRPTVQVEIPVAKVGTNLNNSSFTFESLQRLIKGLEKSAHYRTIVFDTMPSWIKEKK